MKLYLAGPEVFLPDAVAIGKVKCGLCAKHGFEGLYPLDNKIDAPHDQLSKAIFEANVDMIERADAIVANLTPYRGISADVGTAYEVGHAYAAKKKVFGYSNVRTTFVERVRRYAGPLKQGDDGRLYGTDGLAAEDFDRFDNLMLAEALRASGLDVVTPDTEPADIARDMTAFERLLIAIAAVR